MQYFNTLPLVSQNTYNVYGKSIKVKNLGFALLISDFDRAVITIPSEHNNKK